MLYLFVGYLILWALFFGYLFVLGARQKQLQRDLERLCRERPASTSPVQDRW